jgi:hypothetical protein
MKRLMLALAGLVALIGAGAIGYFVARSSAPAPAQPTTAQPTKGKVLYWYDPMVPQQHFAHPGLSPMGMQMVPKYADDDRGDVVRVAPGEVQNLGVRTTAVNVGRLSGTVHVPGTVAWDPQLAVTVSARTDATIEALYVRAPFTAVKAGQPLAAILAPQWSAAAAEYFALAEAKSTQARALRLAARERLHVLGMDDATIRGLRGGERIVTSGQFLLDSEASLSGALQRLGTGTADDQPEPAAPLPPSPENDAMPGMPMPAATASGASHADQPQSAASRPAPPAGSDMSGMAMPASAGTAGTQP